MLRMLITRFRPKDPGRLIRKKADSPIGVSGFFENQFLTLQAKCDWHDFCSDALCPTTMDWQAI